MTNLTKIALSAVAIAVLSGCGDTTVNQTPSNVIIDNSINDSNNANTTPTDPTDPGVTGCPVPTKTKTLSGDYTVNTDLTSDTLWLLDGLVVVSGGATLTIEPCTTIAGMFGTGEATSYMIIDKGSKIIADGTEEEPILFTSAEVALNEEAPAVGQWGGLTIIGNAGNDQVKAYEVNTLYAAGGGKDEDGAIVPGQNLTDSSGVLRHVKILNSGIMMEENREINGLSLVGVGSGTTISNITVDLSDDDCVEAWGGTVNMTDITVSNCTDDHFDIDDGYSGTVTNLKITQATSQYNLATGNAAIEMSGTTAATFDSLTIVQNASAKEGTIYFKGAGIGGHFKNATITDNVTSTTSPAGAIHSDNIGVAIDTVSFENVTLNGTSTEPRFTGDSAAALEEKFDAGVNNIKN